MTLPNTYGVKDPAARENFQYIDERSLLPDLGDLALVASGTSRAGWRPADHAEVSRVEFSELFATIGTSQGAGNGTTTFNLPDAVGTEPSVNLTWIVRVK